MDSFAVLNGKTNYRLHYDPDQWAAKTHALPDKVGTTASATDGVRIRGDQEQSW
jgi:hypothetical protein